MLKIFDELQKKIFSKNDHSICTINKKKILNEIYNIFFNKNIKIKKGLFFFILNFSKRIISKIKLIKFYLIHNNDPETQSYLKVIEKK